MEKQVVSKKRVADHGEVYTNKREVKAMLDLVKQETERIDSRFLEPACGTGNFLAEVLERKLRVVESRYGNSPLDYERNAVVAVASIYGIDILEDNVKQCRERLVGIFVSSCRRPIKDECLRTVRYILERNIIWGDALTLKTVGENPKSIVFSEWSPFNGSMIKRRDFAFHELVTHASRRELPLFSDLGEESFIPDPVREFPLVHYLRLGDAEQT
jgi:SAM-dependent methyltransferase